MTRRQGSVRRARHQRSGRRQGFLVTWDVDSKDSATASHLRRYVFGYSTAKNGKVYRYPGFVDGGDVRYIGQSVLFVEPGRLGELKGFIKEERIAHVVTEACLGRIGAR